MQSRPSGKANDRRELDDEIIRLQSEVSFGLEWARMHISERCKPFFRGLRMVCYKCRITHLRLRFRANRKVSMKATVANIPEILEKGQKSKRPRIGGREAHLNRKPILPPEAPPLAPSARAKRMPASTPDTVLPAVGTGTDPSWIFP